MSNSNVNNMKQSESADTSDIFSPFTIFCHNDNLHGRSSTANLGILDAIRNFLHNAALPALDECDLLQQENVLTDEEKALAGKLDLTDRTNAMTSLIALACLRGSLCDLLMVVKLLLCVSWSNTTTIDRKSLREEQKHAELGNDGVPSTNRNIVNDTTVLLKRLNPIDSKANEDKKAKLIKKKRGQTVQNMLEDREEQLMIEQTVQEMRAVSINRMSMDSNSNKFQINNSTSSVDKKEKNGIVTKDKVGLITSSSQNFERPKSRESVKSSASSKTSVSTVAYSSGGDKSAVNITALKSGDSEQSTSPKGSVSNVNSNKRPASSEASEKEVNKKKQLLLKAKQRDKALIPGTAKYGVGTDVLDNTGSVITEMYTLRNKAKPYHKWIEPLRVTPYLRYLEKAKAQPNLYTRINGSNGHVLNQRNNDREVWTFGQNSYGELVQGDTSTRKSPCRVTAVEGKNIVAVCAGNEHTVFLSGDGLVYTAGYNDNGQCGQGNTDRVGTLSLVEDLKGVANIQQIHAYNGCEHTLVVSNDGRLYSFGYNYRGQLGHGSTSSVFSPRLVSGALFNKKSEDCVLLLLS